MKVIIIGGVAGGASAAARLRRLDEQAEIVLLERGPHISFANCGLPYYVGGVITDRAALTLQTPESFRRRFGIDVRVNSEAVAIDTAAKTVTVQGPDGSYTETYDSLILSPGAAPVVPPLPGLDDPRVFTLRTIPDAVRIREYIDANRPKRAVVVGGGYIGVEMAENLVHAGVKTAIVELSDHLIAPLDYDMACEVHQYARSQGLDLILKNGVQAVEPAPDGSLRVRLNNGALDADLVILSVGVRPDTALAKAAGLELTAKGCIVVDSHMRTSAPGVYAVGDAVQVTDPVTGQPGFVPLAGPANKQGRIAADNICGIASEYKGTQGSSVLKVFGMTVAMTGVNERAAKAAGLDHDKMYTFNNSHAAYYPGASGISMKVLYEKATGRILGAQLVGFEGVDKRCDVLAAAIRAGMTAADLTELELCYAPPYGSAKDPVNYAGYAIEYARTGLVRTFHWHDVAALPRDGSVALLDVRTPAEYAAGHIDGFANLPLDELRQHIGRLDPAKPVFLHCHSGLRSYLACRILAGHGFACYNLTGGYRFYSLVTGETKAAEAPCYPAG